MIIEGVMTSVSAAGEVNIAPMGPMVDVALERFVLRPFQTSTTYGNIKATGAGVFHVTDDALLIARGAIGTLPRELPMRTAERVKGFVLTGACRWFELEVVTLDDSAQRTRIEMRCVHRGELRPFMGFNRARHAVIEAAILATRIHLTGKEPVLAEYDRLSVMVEKTGGADEHTAMAELRAFVENS